MIYFKFTDTKDNEMYGSINVKIPDNITPDKRKEFFEELKKYCYAKTLEEVSREEYDEQDEDEEND